MTPAVPGRAPYRAFFVAASAGTLRAAQRASSAASSSEVVFLIGIHIRVGSDDSIAA